MAEPNTPAVDTERLTASAEQSPDAFLAEVGRLLARSLDYEATLKTVAGLALPGLGSWCIVDLVEPDGSIRRLAIIHPDPERQRLAAHLTHSWPPERDDPLGAPAVMRTRRSEVVPHVTDEMLVEAANGPENLEILRQIGIRSFLVVSMIARGEVLGAITFVAATEDQQYTGDNLALAEDLAARCALTVANARLYQQAERARREAEARVSAVERTEEALRQSEERFRAFVTASSDVVYRMSPDWSEMRHLQGREFIADTHEPSRTWLEKYFHPDDQRRVMEAINEAIRTKSIFELEHRILRVDGTLGWTFSRAIPLLDADGEIVEWFGAASDVTRRKEAEEAVRESQAEAERQRRLYEAIISSTPDLVYVFDLDYRFTFANDALLRMWGRTLEESIGKSLLEIGYEPWHAEMHEREIDRVVATKQPIRGEVAFPHAELGRRIYDYIFVPVLGADGEVEAIAGTTRDVTSASGSRRNGSGCWRARRRPWRRWSTHERKPRRRAGQSPNSWPP
jgi:PAS domain S-box-containing protein